MRPYQPALGLRLGAPFDSHMVLQREHPIRVWGWDVSGGAVAVTLADESNTTVSRAETQASSDGSWSLTLQAQPAGGPYSLHVDGSRQLTFEDVWLGELWLASGQSNMEWTVAQSQAAEATITAATDSGIRYLRVARTAKRSPAVDVEAFWHVVSPDTVGNLTAAGYAFALELRRELGVAVGIIDAAWGGTLVEAWTRREALAQVMDVERELAALEADERNIDSIRRDYALALEAWETRYLPADLDNRGEAEGWAAADAELADWRPLEVPSVWQQQGLAFNGVLWFRTSFEIPSSWQGHDLELSLGRIDDFDHTYVNGTLVGSHPKGTPNACELPRLYRVPAELVRPGKNSLAVRVFDHVGEGGFLDVARTLHVRLEDNPDQRIPLAGTWLYRVERRIALVPMSVFEHFPPTPAVLSPQDRPSALHNGMIAPLLPLSLRGFLFYQGESNAEQHETYAERFIAMIRDWREQFHTPQAPFYFVQLASYRAPRAWAFLREAQDCALAEPHTGRVVTLDIGDANDIHPRNKREVGRRLALLALRRSFGRSEVCDSGPELEAVILNGKQAVVRWRHALGLATTDGNPPLGFEVAGEAGDFAPASASIEGERVVLFADAIDQVARVRYAFDACPAVNLVNGAGLPAAPFRWPPVANGANRAV